MGDYNIGDAALRSGVSAKMIRHYEMETRIAEAQAMKATLGHLVHCCHTDERPRCPILDNLAGAQEHVPPASTAMRASASRSRTIGSPLRRPSTRR